MSRAATAFNDVTYGELPGTEPAYRMIADLDDHLLDHVVGTATDRGSAGAVDGWVEVR